MLDKLEVELKSEGLKKNIRLLLGKDTEDAITENDLESIETLKLDKDILKDLQIGDLVFFKNLKSLSLSGIDIGDKEIDIINQLKNIKTLSITDSRLSLVNSKYTNLNLENLIFVNCKGVDIEHFCGSSNLQTLTIVNCLDAEFTGIEQLTKLRDVNIPNNEHLTDEDIKDLWEVENLEKVNLDGDINISDTEHEGIEVSHESEYRPTEGKDWRTNQKERPSVNFSDITRFSPEQLKSLKGANINVRAEDIEFIKSQAGLEVIKALKANNNINLTLNTTADLNMEDMEDLNSICNFDRVHVQTGWQVTQDQGYSYETYKAIKKEILNIIKDIDPNLPEQQKYLEIRKKLTENIKYDYATLRATPNDKDYYSSRNLENGLLNHTCVCAGYADILKNVLAEVGIEAKYVEGKTNKGELHAWNQVRLKGDDGQYHWYNDDVTWDAVGKDKLKYCLLNDQEFSKTHKCIPSRTEGGQVYSCNAPAPSSIRAAKQNRQYNRQDNGAR